MPVRLGKVIRKPWLSLIMLLSLNFLYYPAFAQEYSDQKEKVSESESTKNVLNINAGAAVVLGLAFKRIHIPINYERVIKPDMSVVIGNHPAIPLNSSESGAAYGASVRIRSYRALNAPQGLWREWGIWGIYQREKSPEKSRNKFLKTYGVSMGGVLFDIGYKFMTRSRMIIEPFVGIAQPLIVLSKKRIQFLGKPFPWAGLSIGFAF